VIFWDAPGYVVAFTTRVGGVSDGIYASLNLTRGTGDDPEKVEENRRLYRMKFDLADQILGSRYGYRRPAGGFCVWLDVSERGGDEAATIKLYREAGVRVVPGSYLARPQSDGSNPGAGFIRLALVADSETTAEALHRLVEILD